MMPNPLLSLPTIRIACSVATLVLFGFAPIGYSQVLPSEPQYSVVIETPPIQNKATEVWLTQSHGPIVETPFARTLPSQDAESSSASVHETNAFIKASRHVDDGTAVQAAGLTTSRIFPGIHGFPGIHIDLQEEIDQQETERTAIYHLGTVQSARHSAVQFRHIAEVSTPLVAKVANDNAVYAEKWADLAESYISLSTRVEEANAKLFATTRDFDDVNSKINAYGLTPTVGMLLRLKKEQLESWQATDSQSFFVSESLKRSREQQLELEMVPFDGTEPIEQARQIVADSGVSTEHAEASGVMSEVRRLLRERQQWLVALWQGHEDYQQKLGELDSASTASVKLTDDYRKLINRHVIWIRSGDPINQDDFRKLRAGMASLLDSERGHEFGFALQRKLRANSASGISILVLCIGILIVRWRAKVWLVGIGSKNRLRDATQSTRFLLASCLTLLVAFAIPAIFYAIARWLGSGLVSESMLQASSGCYACSLIALMVELPRQLLRDFGIVDKYSGVELPRRERACQYLMVVGTGLVLAAYAVTVTGLVDQGMWRESVSRFMLIAACLLVAWTFHRALHPTAGILEPLVAKYVGSILYRMRVVIYLFAIGSPLAVAFLSAVGFGFTANELIKRFAITFSAALIAATLWPALKILAAHLWRILTGAQKLERRFDEYGEIESARDVDLSGGLYLDLKHQIAFLLQCVLVASAVVCLGWLWIDVFPNLRMGNPVVWTIQDTITQTVVDADGQAIQQSVVESTPVTLMHVLLAAATLFVAFQLAKLLPAMFDALVLQRVSFDEGMEHFSLVLGRFILFGAGCLIASKWLGLRWDSIQWIVVGLTIGLGFGLQDMVRNVFGGFIVLFEKPAQLGDLITVGRVTGRVAKQHLRTTVLTDDDGRENIIPNKKFVTDDVVNWMGAGRLTVIPIEVAVTREERPADICRTLFELVRDQPDVLVTPAPQATLVCISKRSQRIEIRAWIEDDKHAVHFRNELLKIVRGDLRGKNMLYSEQPEQPVMKDLARDPSPLASKRRRSA